MRYLKFLKLSVNEKTYKKMPESFQESSMNIYCSYYPAITI